MTDKTQRRNEYITDWKRSHTKTKLLSFNITKDEDRALYEYVTSFPPGMHLTAIKAMIRFFMNNDTLTDELRNQINRKEASNEDDNRNR